VRGWVLGLGAWPQPPTPQSPIPNPQSPIINKNLINSNNNNKIKLIKKNNIIF
jgi:hypothetical protein